MSKMSGHNKGEYLKIKNLNFHITAIVKGDNSLNYKIPMCQVLQNFGKNFVCSWNRFLSLLSAITKCIIKTYY